MPKANVIWIEEQQKKLTVISLGVLQRFVSEFKQEFIEDDVVLR